MSATQMRTGADRLIEGLRSHREGLYTGGSILDDGGVGREVWPVGLTRDRGAALAELVRSRGAVSIVETGFAYGLSASWLLEGALGSWSDLGCPEDRRPGLVSIDPYQTKVWGGAGRRHLREAGVGGMHTHLEERSETAMARAFLERRVFDFAFIDGDHRFEYAFVDTFFARRLVPAGALIVLDDAWMPAVRKCAGFFVAAGLCGRVAGVGPVAEEKFVVLEKLSEGDERAWDAFEEF